MIEPIYIYGHPVLRKVSPAVEKDYPDLKKLIENLKDTMYKSDGIGIAAPQIGVNARVIYIDAGVLADTFPELEGKKLVLVNPEVEVLDDGDRCSREEGCLSLPGIHENVTRTEKVNLKWLDEDFNSHEEEISGYLARVIQHEYDHLDGILFIDHIAPIRKQLIRGKLANLVKGKVHCDYRTKCFKK
ncbi:MAG: peptide deformylase [Muribaculaceae bacterium]|jgi:peptide deformylase|nr:peptide deformylase [Muribaculaceae bacterium]